MFPAGAISLCPDLRDLCIPGVQGKLLVEGMMSTVRRSARAHCLSADWTCAPSAGWPWRRRQRTGQDALNAERARRSSAWWQAARLLSNKCRGCGVMGLASGPAHWLMSRATSHAAATGFCLSGERRVGPGRVSAPDPYSSRGSPRPGTLLRPGPYSAGPGAYPRDPACLLGSPGLVCTGVRWRTVGVRTERCILGCITFPCHVVPLGLPTWWGRVPFSVWPGDVVHVHHLHAVEEDTPDLGYRQFAIWRY
jgi:hypothetical protein